MSSSPAWWLVLALLASVVLVGAPADGSAQERPPAARAAETLLDVPFIPQSELLCGGAAAAMVLRYWGAEGVDAEEFRPLVRPDEGGIRGGELAAELRGRGWRTLTFSGHAAEVRRQIERGRPVVTLLEVEPDRFHFVVVVAWTEGGVVFHDPARAPFRVLTPAEFDEAWQASGRWTLLVLPSDRTAGSRGGPADSTSFFGEVDPAAPPDVSGEDACRSRILEAVERAARGRLAAAEELLVEAVRGCPGSARARTELAGLRARQERWEEARDLAREATTLDPGQSHAWRILATSRYLTGDRRRALAAWNRLGEPRIERIRIQGLDRTRYEPVRERIDLRPDSLLTATAFVRSARRLELLPVAAATRLEYVARGDGRAEVRAALLERPLLPRTVPAWLVILAGGAVRKEVSVGLAGPAGAGELWTWSVRFEEHRPRLALEVDVPAPPVLPGVATLAVEWERQTFRVAEGAGVNAGRDTLVEERRSGRVETTDWATGRLRWKAGVGVDRWEGGPTDASMRAGLEIRTLSDRFSIWTEGLLAASLTGDRKRSYARGSFGTAWRSTAVRRGPVVHLQGTATQATPEAPLSYWPGAGGGRARDGLLRAHPLLDGGIVVGPAFGRTLVNGGAELRWWIPLPWPVALAPAAFLDLARPWHRPVAEDGRVHADAGAGIRISAPGPAGVLRLDLARGLRSGGWRVEAGLDAPWPGIGGS